MSDPTRLSSYPYVIVRVGCTRCTRKGSYKLGRLAQRYGAEALLPDVLKALSKDCAFAGIKRHAGHYETCGALFLDLIGDRPPDLPAGVVMRPRLVGGRG